MLEGAFLIGERSGRLRRRQQRRGGGLSQPMAAQLVGADGHGLSQIQNRIMRIGRNVNQVMTARYFGVAQAARFGAEHQRDRAARHSLNQTRNDLIRWADELPPRQTADRADVAATSTQSATASPKSATMRHRSNTSSP